MKGINPFLKGSNRRVKSINSKTCISLVEKRTSYLQEDGVRRSESCKAGRDVDVRSFPVSGAFSYMYVSGQIIATSAEVTPNGSLVRDSPNNALNSGLGIIVIWPDVLCIWVFPQIMVPPNHPF